MAELAAMKSAGVGNTVTWVLTGPAITEIRQPKSAHLHDNFCLLSFPWNKV